MRVFLYYLLKFAIKSPDTLAINSEFSKTSLQLSELYYAKKASPT